MLWWIVFSFVASMWWAFMGYIVFNSAFILNIESRLLEEAQKGLMG